MAKVNVPFEMVDRHTLAEVLDWSVLELKRVSAQEEIKATDLRLVLDVLNELSKKNNGGNGPTVI